jgi:high-affinity K+ transport system ATPase subunit B
VTDLAWINSHNQSGLKNLLDLAVISSPPQANGHTVGFLGDEINDAAALREADVGVSVDTAADIPKQAHTLQRRSSFDVSMPR